MKKITVDSRLGEIWATPVGHDVLAKILMQLGIPESIITRPLVRSLKLRNVMDLAKRKGLYGKDPAPDAPRRLAEELACVINSEQDEVVPKDGPPTPAWWKEAVFYQIYPRSFKDTNGDGIGDLRGIIEKLDYLKDLGVNALWLSPIYDSPQDDNGYDIRDYRKIDSLFGSMEDFDELLAGVHERGMHLIMDLVVNHTSDEHEWFKEALADPQSKYRNYYFFREGKDAGDAPAASAARSDGAPDTTDPGTPPNNWDSFFGGKAWNYYPEQNVWAMHLFSKKQMDLNWDCPELREDILDMIRFWLEKGVDGFRMDVINYISKKTGLPDGNTTIGALMNFTGIEHYFYGPRMHEYFRQIRREAFEPYKAFSVGETPGFGMKMAQLATAGERKELDMIFSFDHLETPGHVRYDDYKYDLNYLRDYLVDWMQNYGSQCWMSLFYNNHDNPRMASKVDPAVSKDPVLRRRIQTLLAVIQFTLRGTPFIYQGDEMGLVNYDFADISELSDVEVRGLYKIFLETMTPEAAWEKALCGTRDHARVLLPWNDFPADRPERMKQEPDEQMTQLYKRLIALRASSPALTYGDFVLLDGSKDHFSYTRLPFIDTPADAAKADTSENTTNEASSECPCAAYRDAQFNIECNLSGEPIKVRHAPWGKTQTLLFSTDLGFTEAAYDEAAEEWVYPDPAKSAAALDEKTLAPYEARIWV